MYAFFVILLAIFILSLLLLLFCRDSQHFHGLDKNLDKNIFGALFQRFYFVTTTLTTIGYGDIAPKTLRAKVIVVIFIIVVLGIVMQALSSLAAFVETEFLNKVINKTQTIITKYNTPSGSLGGSISSSIFGTEQKKEEEKKNEASS